MNTDKTTPYNQDPKFKFSLLHPKYVPTWIGMGFIYLCKFLPYKVLIYLGTLFGYLLYGVSPHRKQIAEANIKLCFPDKSQIEIHDLVKDHFKNIGIGIFEIAIAWWSSDKTIENLKRSSKNLDIFKELDKEKGVLILIKHSTHVELDIRLMAKEIELGGMYKPQSNEVMNYLMIRARNKYVVGAIHNHQAKQAIQWINNGQKFLYAADQDYGEKNSQFIPFFGIDAATVTFPEKLSRSGVKIVMANVSKNLEGFDLEFHEIADYKEEGSVLKEVNQFYEKYILKSPENFLWTHRRFKSRPQGQESIYSEWKSRDKRRKKKRLARK
jgi:KDO2-lipid IV(A) lauroyltransferase|tara:strand:- start:3166 stop:4143 length:978 start_codon:yes stop_codon:yes gene_type:complete